MTDGNKAVKSKPTQEKRFFIADGVEVTTKRGQLKTGEVKAKDFPGGAGRIDALVKLGALVEK